MHESEELCRTRRRHGGVAPIALWRRRPTPPPDGHWHWTLSTPPKRQSNMARLTTDVDCNTGGIQGRVSATSCTAPNTTSGKVLGRTSRGRSDFECAWGSAMQRLPSVNLPFRIYLDCCSQQDFQDGARRRPPHHRPQFHRCYPQCPRLSRADTSTHVYKWWLHTAKQLGLSAKRPPSLEAPGPLTICWKRMRKLRRRAIGVDSPFCGSLLHGMWHQGEARQCRQ